MQISNPRIRGMGKSGKKIEEREDKYLQIYP